MMHAGSSRLIRSEISRIFQSARAILVFILLGIMLALMSQAFVDGGIKSLLSTLRTDSSLTLIEVSSLPEGGRQDLDSQALGEMRAVPNVVEVRPWEQLAAGLADDKDWPNREENPGQLSLTPVVSGLTPRIKSGPDNAFETLAPGQIILPEFVPGGSLSDLLGREVRIEYTKIVSKTSGEPGYITLKVVAIADNSVPDLAGPTPAYVSVDDLHRVQLLSSDTEERAGDPTTVFVRASDVSAVPAVQADLARLGFSVRSVASQNPQLDGALQLLSLAAPALIGASVLAAVGGGFSLASLWVRQRQSDLGLLRALGYTRADVFWVIMVEMGLIGLLVGITAAALGVIAAMGLTAAAAAFAASVVPVVAWTAPPIALVLLLAFVPAVCMMLGAVRPATRAARLEPDEALRSA